MKAFTKAKFLALPLKVQHKHAARMISEAHKDPSKLHLYRNIEVWMDLTPVKHSHESLSHRFHFHLNAANIQLRESSLLAKNCQLDTLSNEPLLPIDIYLDHLRSTHNIGAIIRTIEAFRLGALYLDEKTPSKDHPKIQKTAMGAEQITSIKKLSSFQDLKKPIIAIETTENATSVFDYTFPQDGFSLLFGNEEYGLSQEALSHAHDIVHIPLVGMKNSLNVAVSFGIIAFEIKRQLYCRLLETPF